MMEPYGDIPRLYTALAECVACYVSLLLFPRKKKPLLLIGTSIAFFVIQISLLVFTDHVKLPFWIPVMIAAVMIMFAYLKLCCDMSMTYTGFVTLAAFLQAETAASLEWQIHCYLIYDEHVPSFFIPIILIIVYAFVFTIFYFMSKSTVKDVKLTINFRELITSVLITSLAFAFSNLSFVTTKIPFTSPYRQEIFTIRTLVDLVGLGITYSYQSRLGELKLRNELNNIQTILDSQYQNFLNYQESIDVINIKYHDLKHQINALRQEEDPVKREEWINSMERELELYNINFNSGSRVLDTILATKELQCKQHNIDITFIVNGGILGFMTDSDVVSLFSNALDNAIEAVSQIANPEQRMIHLEVSEKRRFVYIFCENYINHDVKLKNGIPVSTKKDKRLHGFGVKSIKYTVKKYSGNVIIDTKDNWFQIKILIPIKGESR